MTSACQRYGNPFDPDHPAVLALLQTKRSRVSHAPATSKNRHWAAVELYVYWMWGLLPHLPREVRSRLPLHLPDRPSISAIKASLTNGSPARCCLADHACHVDVLSYIAGTKGSPAHPPLRGTPPERRRNSTPAERDELARNVYRRSNRWGM